MWKQYGKYEVSENGEIRNATTKYVLQGNIKKNGYIEYCLYDDDGVQHYELGHIIVAKLFIENQNNYNQVNHIDGNKQNNNVQNLEWVSSSMNNKHAWDLKLNRPHVLRPVYQYNLNHELLRKFESVAEAHRVTGAAKIREVANGQRKTSGGFIWEWAEDFIPEDRGRAKKVAMLDDDFNIIAIYPSISEAARQTGINRKGINAVCLGQQKKSGNHFWKFYNEDIVQ